jgi:hypothetical protein
LTYLACTGNQQHCMNADIASEEVLTPPAPLSTVPCQIHCGGRCCPQNTLFPYICVAPGICTEIYPIHYCEGISCSPSVPCDTANPGCCPVKQICGGTCCPPDTVLSSYVCVSGKICTEIPAAHYCGSVQCQPHIPCDTTGTGCCPDEKICGETCCLPNTATVNFECDPNSQTCKALKRCNDDDNPCIGSTCLDDGYCCPDSLACGTICCTPPQVPPSLPPWGCACKAKSVCCPSGDIGADDGTCCPVDQAILLRDPPRIACCVLPTRPYIDQCCEVDETLCYTPDAVAACPTEPRNFR